MKNLIQKPESQARLAEMKLELKRLLEQTK
jgi:hypothetical protein